MTTPYRKKLIEVSIPLEAINVASAREKDVKVGKHTSMHQWFAPRPIATCRAVLFAQLVDDPSSWPDKFPTEELQAAERQRLHNVIERLVPWEAAKDETILNEARWEIARSVAWGRGEEPPPRDDGEAILDFLQTKAPPVCDPFSGGGSIPLEAQRLGIRVSGSDLNPVAVLIGKALVEIPPKFAGQPPVNPAAQAELKRGGRWNGKGAQGLSDDVRYYGQWMRDEVEKSIGDLYPSATLSDGSKATVVAWLWARTVRSPDPAAQGAKVPLVSSFMLSTKEGKKAWVEVVIDPAAVDGWRFEAKAGQTTKLDEERLKRGTKAGKGQAFVCALTGSPIDRVYIQKEGKAGRLSERLMVIVAEGHRRRIYISPTPEHEASAKKASEYPSVDDGRATFLAAPTPTRAMITGGVCSAYGLRTYGHIFNSRQLLALSMLSDLVGEARSKVLADAIALGREDVATPLHEGGLGAMAYADAVATYLAFVVDKNAQTLNSLVRWFPQGEKAQPAFERQAFPMSWDFAEANVLGSSTGSIQNCTKYVALTLERWGGLSPASIKMQDAQVLKESIEKVVISTDPPYYDNIAYAELSDFFYIWLRRSLGTVWPDLFRRVLTPKDEELVATAYRHGGKAEAEAFFMRGMSLSLIAMRQAASDNGPLVIYYAFKQSETSTGTTAAGWSSFLQAIVNAGLGVDGTWPVRTEHSSKMISQGGANVLASSIVLVCRKREGSVSTARADFVASLRRELPDAISKIRAAGVGPVDMQQSVIGPGMGVFTRYAEVLEDDDSAMSVKTALTLINRVWEELDGELVASLDPETQVALAWFGSHGFEARPSGELITTANAKNTSVDALFASGVFVNLHGKAALTPRGQLPRGWHPSTDRNLTVWECVQHTARVLNDAETGGQDAAARLVAEMGMRATDARALLDRLFRIATEKGWASEALVYNQLAEEWPRLLDRAPAVKPATPEAPDLFAAG